MGSRVWLGIEFERRRATVSYRSISGFEFTFMLIGRNEMTEFGNGCEMTFECGVRAEYI